MSHPEAKGWLKAWRLIFGQEDNSTGPLETTCALINIDGVFEAGELDAEDLAQLRQYLAESPILRRLEFRQETAKVRADIGHDAAVYWWWWPERLWPGVAPKPFTLADYIREYGEEG